MTGCVKEADWSMDGQPPDIIIVDAVLTDERKAQTISITYPVAGLNENPQPLTGASILISNEDSVWQLNENMESPGYYITPPYFAAQLEKNYTLLISFNDKIISGKATMVKGSVFQELQYVKNTNDNLYHIDWVASAFSAEDPAMWEVLIDWSGVPGYEQAGVSQCQARMLFYTLPTLDVSEIFAPEVEKISFPAGTIITERRYSLTPQHAGFIREMLLETSWTGGFFNEATANVITNLSKGAVGYFGLCAVTSLSLTVTP
jgi:hypothetical protein